MLGTGQGMYRAHLSASLIGFFVQMDLSRIPQINRLGTSCVVLGTQCGGNRKDTGTAAPHTGLSLNPGPDWLCGLEEVMY